MAIRLEDQVCSLESAKRLKELGFSQRDTLFYWIEVIPGDNPNHWPGDKKPKVEFKIFNHRPHGRYNWDTYLGPEKFYSAYTVAELGELLPDMIIDLNHKEGYWSINQAKIMLAGNLFYFLELVGDESNQVRVSYKDKNEVEARSKMLLYLAEHKLIEVKQ